MIPLQKHTFLNEHETKKALAEFILRADRLSMGVQCAEFEKAFADKQGRDDAILVNSGGSANLVLLQSLKNLGRLKEGDMVGFSSLTWSTNVMPIIQMGFIPVIIDCNPQTLNVMSYNLEDRLKEKKIRAFFATNVLGFAGDLNIIHDLCKKNDIIFIEDNCESLGTELLSGKTGNFGLAATFSFFVAHHMSTIEGGMLVTNDTDLAQMCRMVRANGWDRNLNAVAQHTLRKKHNVQSEFAAKYTFYHNAFNVRPTEITGFLGYTQLQYLDKNVQTRQKYYLQLEKLVKQNEDFLPIQRNHIKTLSVFAFPIICKTPRLREKYMAQFSGAGIEIRPMIAGNMQYQPFYTPFAEKVKLPGADMLHHNGFYCGHYPELTNHDLEIISSCLQKYA